MKFQFKKSTLIKFGLIVALLVIAPFLVPFALEFVILADLMGLEALIVLLLASGKSVINSVRIRLQELSSHIGETLILVSEVYMFRPKVFCGHATASSLVVVCVSSVLLACAVWLPVMLASSQLVGLNM